MSRFRRMVCPGRVYRRDKDATHLPMFHQLECLVVDEDVSLGDLQGTLAAVWSRFFGDEVGIRLRPGYFPFVEPGAEYDVSCAACCFRYSARSRLFRAKRSSLLSLILCGPPFRAYVGSPTPCI